jgi:hypothetical protein
MKKTRTLTALALLLTGFFLTTLTWAQEKKEVPSPPATATGKVAGSDITINYGSPAVKGRTLFGPEGSQALEKYGKVWRAGANDATTFETSKDIKVEGKTLPAGKYALFTIPTENQWTVIFNKTAKQWGAYKYDEGQDALRVMVKPKKSASMNERLKYDVTKNGFALKWGDVEVPVALK